MNPRNFINIAYLLMSVAQMDGQYVPYLKHVLHYMQTYNDFTIKSVVYVTNDEYYFQGKAPCDDTKDIVPSQENMVFFLCATLSDRNNNILRGALTNICSLVG